MDTAANIPAEAAPPSGKDIQEEHAQVQAKLARAQFGYAVYKNDKVQIMENINASIPKKSKKKVKAKAKKNEEEEELPLLSILALSFKPLDSLEDLDSIGMDDKDREWN